MNVWFNPADGWYWCDGIITDKTAENLIKDRGWSVSCSYDYKEATGGGTENNIPYDIEFLDGEFSHLAIVENPRYERANIVFNSKTAENGGKGSGNFDHDGRPGQIGGSASSNENVTRKYAQYNDLENDYKEFIDKEPENYDINNIDEVLKDLGITPTQPLKIKTPIENVNISIQSIEHIVGGGGENHPPDVTRFKSINKMLATLKEPIFINEINGQKYYFKIFQNDDKSKKDIVIVSSDNEVFTNFPVDRSNWFLKTLKQGKTVYDIKNKRRKSDNNAAHVNNIVTDIQEDFNPTVNNCKFNFESIFAEALAEAIMNDLLKPEK